MMTSEARRRAVSSARSAVTIKGTGCCPPFDPTSWQARELVWNEKLFVVDRVHSLLHVPIDMARKVRLNRARIDAAAAAPSRGLMLLDEDSLWGADLYLEVTRPVAGAKMTTLSGKFRTEIFEGAFHKVGDWATEMRERVAASGARVEKIYFDYTTCPRCAKAYGKNYVVLFAKLADPPAAVHSEWQPSWQPPRSDRSNQTRR
jgi:hypothetical protein